MKKKSMKRTIAIIGLVLFAILVVKMPMETELSKEEISKEQSLYQQDDIVISASEIYEVPEDDIVISASEVYEVK